MSDRAYSRKHRSSSTSSRSSSISLSSSPHGADPFLDSHTFTRSPTSPSSAQQSSFPHRQGPTTASMAQRAAYHQPSTPVFTLESDGTAAASSPPTRHFLGDGSPRLGVGALPTHHSSSTRPEGDYFPDNEKYPPGASKHNSSPSSVRIPLLVDDPSRNSIDFDRSSRGAHAGASSWLPLSSRARLHPIMLIPAFVIGVFLAMSGLFGPTMSRDASPTAFVSVASRRRASPFALPNSDVQLTRSTTRLQRSSSISAASADYTIHKSGHLYLNPSSLDPSSASYPLPRPKANAAPQGVRHPINDLIANATKQWEDKLARQSKTLEEAVREYKRRHGRKPPKGFDDW